MYKSGVVQSKYVALCTHVVLAVHDFTNLYSCVNKSLYVSFNMHICFTESLAYKNCCLSVINTPQCTFPQYRLLDYSQFFICFSNNMLLANCSCDL